MSDVLNTVGKLPDISFIDGMSLSDVQSLMIGAFQDKYKEITGKSVVLSRADPNRIILLACAQYIYQGLQNIDKAGKMNFLKYAYDGYLDNLAALKKITRKDAAKATVPVMFELSAPRESATGIPEGTRVTAAYEVYFATTEYAEIPPGETELLVTAECTEAGTVGNGYTAGEIGTLVDPIGFVSRAYNTETSSGGMDVEDDASMAERVYLAPSSFSVAGPDDAYVYWVMDCRSDIRDVKITSPSDGVVDIRFLMDDGSVPDAAVIAAVQEHVQQRGKRPLTDHVQVNAPEIEQYEVDVKYYINSSDSSSAAAIQRQVDAAIKEYIMWQETKIGRDINPDELIARIKNAGAKRAIVKAPTFRTIGETAKAQISGEPNIVYGGLEID